MVILNMNCILTVWFVLCPSFIPTKSYWTEALVSNSMLPATVFSYARSVDTGRPPPPTGRPATSRCFIQKPAFFFTMSAQYSRKQLLSVVKLMMYYSETHPIFISVFELLAVYLGLKKRKEKKEIPESKRHLPVLTILTCMSPLNAFQIQRHFTNIFCCILGDVSYICFLF